MKLKRVLYILLSFSILLTMNLPALTVARAEGNPTIELNVTGNLNQYYNAMESVSFNAAATPAAALIWYVNGVPQDVSGTAFTYTPTYIGTYEVSVEAADAPSVTASKTITVSPATDENTLLALSYTPAGGSESVNLLGGASPAFTYRVALAAGDTAVPAINYFKKDPASQVTVQNAASIPGATTVVVSGAAGTTPKTYTLIWDNSGDFKYTTSGGTSTVTGYTGSGSTVTIPDVIGGKFVTVLSCSASNAYPQVSTLITPNSAEVITDGAFAFCENLNTVILTPNIKVISDSAFAACSKLDKVVIPRGVTDIELGAFTGCNGLTAIYVDKNNVNYSSQDGVLFNKAKTVLVEYPQGKTGTQYTVPSGVLDVEKYAFMNCNKLTSITIPNSVVNIKQEAFINCKLVSVTLSNGLETIGDSAFSGCSDLTSIAIPNSVTDIGSFAFAECTSLEDINVDANNTFYCGVDGVLFNKAKTVLVQYPCKKGNASYVIPDSVTKIGDGAFATCDLTDLVIADGVTDIGEKAIADCPKLTSVTIPPSVTSIGKYIFGETDKTKLTIYCETGSAAEIYAKTNGYLYKSVPATPAAATKTYTPGLKLSDVALPAGYVWAQPDTLLSVPGGNYSAVYTPTEEGESPITVELTVTVVKADPDISFPTPAPVTYKKNLKLSDIPLPSGFAWEQPSKTLDAPGGSYRVIYTPGDTVNYNILTRSVEVTVNNASQRAPVLRVLSRTEDTIIIDPVSGAEYAIKLRSSSADPVYGSNNKFTSLNDDTQYTVYIRLAGKKNYDPSPEVSLNVRTDKSGRNGGGITISTGSKSMPADIGQVPWALEYIEDVIKKGIMIGSDNGDGTVSFRPQDNITRAEFATALYKYMGYKAYAYVPFDDTKDHWAIEYISCLAKDGIMTGTGNNLFEPDKPITREEIATILNRAFKPLVKMSDFRYADNSGISDWAVEGVYKVYSAGWMTGDDTGTFRPNDTATRAEIAAIFSRLATARVY